MHGILGVSHIADDSTSYIHHQPAILAVDALKFALVLLGVDHLQIDEQLHSPHSYTNVHQAVQDFKPVLFAIVKYKKIGEKMLVSIKYKGKAD